MSTFLFLMYGVICLLLGFKVGRVMTYGKSLDLNVLAKTVTMLEGKKKSMSIAQVKEVMSRVFDVLSRHSKDVIYLTIKKGN